MTHSPTLGELFAALAKAQGEIKNATKSSTATITKSGTKAHYADLTSIWDACRAALAANGLAVSQPVSVDGAVVTVTTILGHASGQYVSEVMTLVAADDSVRSVGSAITYARRYALAPIVGVTTEDDDGVLASEAAASEAAQAEEQRRKDKLAAKVAAKNGTATQPPISQEEASRREAYEQAQHDAADGIPMGLQRLAELRRAMFEREPVENEDAAWKSILAKRGVASAKELSPKGLEELTAAIEKKIADYDRDIDSFRGEASHDGLAAPAALAG